MRILFAGATSWIGRSLGVELAKSGHELVVLARDTARAKAICPFPAEWHEWKSVSDPIPEADFTGKIDAVLSLIGEPIAKSRWNSKVKNELRKSRIEGTRALAELVRKDKIPTFVSASATGFYGDRGEEVLSENASKGEDFLAELTSDWEDQIFSVPKDTRCIALRIGIVLGRNGGALEKLVPIYQTGLGGPLADGSQWFSWIHKQDLERLIIECLENKSYCGIVNAVAPKPVRQIEFAKELGRILGRPTVVPAPKFSLDLAVGEMAKFLVASQRVESKSTQEFKFNFPSITLALKQILEPESRGESLLIAQQYVDRPLKEVFPFFSDEKNLQRLTPVFLNFKVVGKNTKEIEEGTLIDYTLKIHGVPCRWRTKIIQWNPPTHFVDTQLKGPYSFWHHTHLFEPIGKGTLITDRVRYKVPLGFLGALTAGWLVRKDVENIFAYRQKVIAHEIWPAIT